MRIALLSGILLLSLCAKSQNVFDPADSTYRWDSTKTLGTRENPNPAPAGLQKWVSVPTNSISIGYGAWDATSYKAYYINKSGVRMAFRLKFPHSFTNPDSANKKYPVMLFFHGAGEPGCPANGGIYNNEKQLLHGGQLFSERVDNNLFDGFLLYPQAVVPNCANYWSSTYDQAILAVLDSLIKYARADIDRLFVDGLSDGGRTTWRFARAYPQRVATIAPSSMAARVSAAALAPIVHIPVWFATGGLDSNPSPEEAQQTLNDFTNLGGNIRYTLYPELGHSVWNQHWAEPDFVPFMNKTHKANPLVFFLHDAWCSPGTVAARLGLTAGFYQYEWQKEDVTIARSTNGANSILVAAAVTSFTGNEIVVKQYGTYRARFKRTSTSNWSEWSPIPVVIKVKDITQPDPITVYGMHSKVLPALDGSTTVPLALDSGFFNYTWYASGSTALLDTGRVFEAGLGSYRGMYEEKFGCGSLYSPDFVVVDANGSPKPSPATNLVAAPVSQTSLALTWTDDPAPASNETNYEIYRGTKPGGPYQLVYITVADTAGYQDNGLTPNTSYYYVVRAVNNTGASAGTNEAAGKTLIDNTAPSAPTGVMYSGSTLTSVSLRWNPSSDNINVKRYDIYVNNVKNYSTTGTTFTINNLESLKWYSFVVKAVDGSGNASAPSPQVMGYTHRPGLNYKYYHGTYTLLPDFNTLTPVKTGVVNTITSGSSFRTQDDNYAVLWEGYIYIPQTANYYFATISDEGSKMWIDVPYSADATPVVNADGIHEANLILGAVSLTK
jgi:chitodextrinase/dienelactone hydrolase